MKHSRAMRSLMVALSLFLSFSAVGCSKKSAKDAAASLLGGDDLPAYKAPVGAAATQYLASAHDVTPVDPVALSSALDIAAADAAQQAGTSLLDGTTNAAVGQTSGNTVGFLKAAAQQKSAIDTTTFANPTISTFADPNFSQRASRMLFDFDPSTVPSINDPTGFDPKSDTVALDSTTWNGQTQIMISRLGQIPVKNQGQRGTCAAHAGVGVLEYLILKKYASKITTINLSEQRFYMMSKAGLWSTGGVPGTDAGSNWYNGFAESFGVGGTTVPSTSATYNIPLQDDCPYNATPGANELQLPQLLSCERGSVRVTSLSETFYIQQGSGPKQWHSSGLLTATDILNYLIKYDLPVPVAANITQNWANNDGTITYAKDQTSPQALGGHAFLVVGARQLDQTKFPNEGGMCFIVKNSWGPGWGTNGFACMTLAWFNHFRDGNVFGIPFDVDVDLTYVLSNAQKTIPSGITSATSSLLDASTTTEPMPVQPVTLSSTPTDPDISDIAVADASPAATPDSPAASPSPTPSPSPSSSPSPAPSPSPSPAVTTTTDGFTLASLIDQNGDQFKVLYKTDTTANTITLVGILKGETSVTKALTLGFDATSNTVSYNDPVRGSTLVGTLSGSVLNVCGQIYADVCLLNLQTSDNSLVIGLTQDQYYTFPADPNASYKTLVEFDGYGIDFALAPPNFADFRLELAGTPTNGLRLMIDAVSGAITYGGREVGNYQSLELCSGSHRSVCRLVVNTDDHSLNLFLKAK